MERNLRSIFHAVGTEDQLKRSNDMLLDISAKITSRAVLLLHHSRSESVFLQGWQILILSGINTIISEKTILDHNNFWATFPLHFTIGFLRFCLSAILIYRRERVFINRIIPFQESRSCRLTSTKKHVIDI
ncbi:unnamed protein product [Eruca vesicaria subsp. sativa]|uniref:Man(5)GlcNAc(2)-PP-dolichol translocation protein RFT1 n=1 Tax=Eruca vesicaria subsp. sativa TaxID=29727 RepID=A0ABC8J3H5_ERUVS|nr:unnamed protein product [Eruca vesicaria subsp. sativa]